MRMNPYSSSPLHSPYLYIHVYSPAALTDTATLQGSYDFYHLANEHVTEYLRNYNLTTIPYHYYQYIQS